MGVSFALLRGKLIKKGKSMAAFEKFNYSSLEALREGIARLGLDIPTTTELSALRAPLRVGTRIAPNRLATLPMEGCDGEPDGTPSPLVLRRYLRFAAGGAGLIWFEACAIVPEGRANPLQMHINPDNVKAFSELVQAVHAEAIAKRGARPLCILQLTHSGRYSRPAGTKPAPIIAQHDPLLDPRVGLDENRLSSVMRRWTRCRKNMCRAPCLRRQRALTAWT